MESKKEVKGVPPAYRGEGVAVWINKDKNGKDYLTIQLLGKNGIRVNCFEVEAKQ